MKKFMDWKLYRTRWSVWFASLGLLLPDLLQLLADNSRLLPWFSDENKSVIYIVCLIGVLVTRGLPQRTP